MTGVRIDTEKDGPETCVRGVLLLPDGEFHGKWQRPGPTWTRPMLLVQALKEYEHRQSEQRIVGIPTAEDQAARARRVADARRAVAAALRPKGFREDVASARMADGNVRVYRLVPRKVEGPKIVWDVAYDQGDEVGRVHEEDFPSYHAALKAVAAILLRFPHWVEERLCRDPKVQEEYDRLLAAKKAEAAKQEAEEAELRRQREEQTAAHRRVTERFAGGATRRKVVIPVEDHRGKSTVETSAMVVGPFAVHKAEVLESGARGFTVTHLPTGRKAFDVVTTAHGVIVAGCLAAAHGWEFTAVSKMPKALKRWVASLAPAVRAEDWVGVELLLAAAPKPPETP
jgi:hypothetical protein